MWSVASTPYRGAGSTVEQIRRKAKECQGPEIRALAETIISELKPKDYLSELLAVFYFAHQRTRYTKDPRTIELVKSPLLVADELARGRTPALDCDDMACLITALCLALGHGCRIVTVAFKHMTYRGERQYSHVFCQALEPTADRWITLDPVPYDTRDMLDATVAARIWPV